MNEEYKQAVKEGIKEWLNDQVQSFGWWSLRTIGAAALVALVAFLLKTKGVI